MTDISSWLEHETPKVRGFVSRFNIIMARDFDTLLCGFNNRMPWYIQEDLEYFRKVTMGSIVVMGRNTMESINCKPLKGRTNIVISKSLVEAPEGFYLIRSLTEIFFMNPDTPVFFIGGPKLLTTVLNSYFVAPSLTVFLTEVKDIFVPEHNNSTFLHDTCLFRQGVNPTELFRSGWMDCQNSSAKVNFVGYKV